MARSRDLDKETKIMEFIENKHTWAETKAKFGISDTQIARIKKRWDKSGSKPSSNSVSVTNPNTITNINTNTNTNSTQSNTPVESSANFVGEMDKSKSDSETESNSVNNVDKSNLTKEEKEWLYKQIFKKAGNHNGKYRWDLAEQVTKKLNLI